MTRHARADLEAALRVLRDLRGEAALAVHENPDYDALGAAVGVIDLLAQRGCCARLHLREGTRLPAGEDLTEPGMVVEGPPAAGVPLIVLDTGSLQRMALDVPAGEVPALNVDHHHDNTRFALVNLVRPQASSVSEIVCDLAQGLGVAPSTVGASALYTGISFDSGHFRHASTSAHTFSTAGWLVSLGADPTALYRALYERRSRASLMLWARAFENAAAVAGGRGYVSVLTHDDYEDARGGEDQTEGIVEALRAIDGVDVAALVKEQSEGPRVRVSLRSRALDVSAVAALQGGGGHVHAAGFSSDEGPREVARWLSSELAARLATASS